MNDQMTFADLNPSVAVCDEPRLSKQGRKMLDLFEGRKMLNLTVSTIDLREIGCQYNARLWEVRRYLAARKGRCIDLVRKDPKHEGVNHYAIVKLSESTFYEKHRDKFPA